MRALAHADRKQRGREPVAGSFGPMGSTATGGPATGFAFEIEIPSIHERFIETTSVPRIWSPGARASRAQSSLIVNGMVIASM